jgi:hypothetical protein
MKKFLVVVFFCLPACGQAAYSGLGLYSGSAAYGASVCGPGNGYGCFVSNTNVINYATPIPSWGPNTCDSTNMDTLSQCGNLTGAGMAITPSDFGNAMTRCTDVNTNGNPNTNWQTADEPSVNLWNSDDTAMLLLVNGGSQFVFLWDGSHCAILTTSTGGNITFPAGTIWSYLNNNVIYSLDNTTGPGIYIQKKTVTLAQGSGAVSSTNLFDLTNSQCLMNSVNGYPSDPSYTGGSFPLNKWTGSTGVNKDETTFTVPFSLLGGQGSGYYQVVWTVGQPGCDLWNTLTGVVTHNGTLVGTISDAPWNGQSCPGGTCGAKGSRGKIHDSNMPNATTVALSWGANSYTYGTYNDGPFFWQKGTTNVVHCGVGEAHWQASTAYSDGDRIQPSNTGAANPGNYIYQIINGVSGNSGTSAPVWDQTPGHDVTETSGTPPLVWRNTGVGTAQEYNCDGHAWKGAIGYGSGKQVTYHTYADPTVPRLILGPSISPAQVGDTHLGNTNANATDTNWIWVTSTDVGTATNLLTGPLPSALYMESFFVAPPYSSPGLQNCVYDAILCPSGTLGQVRRAFHCFGSGWHKSFDVQNCIAVVSQTGKYAMLATDGMGQLGNTAGTTNVPSTWLAKCNVGAPNWIKSDSTDFVVGSKMFPDPQLASTVGSNTGAYIYQVQSCSGTCTTGATHPTWTQSPTVAGVGTISDGTITWVAAPDVNTPANTAAQNCRADVMVVKLTR